MVIGQQFLMPKNNKLIQPKELSIHLFMNGFSFCTQSKIDFIPSPNSLILNLPKELDKFLNQYPKETFSNISLIFFNGPSTFVPESLYESGLIKQYLQYYKKTDPKDIYSYDSLEGEVNLYSYSEVIKKIINQASKPIKYIHYNSILFRIIKKISQKKKRPQFHIHLQKGFADLFLIKNEQLIFNNRFSVKTEDEFLYYVFFIVEQFLLEIDSFDFVFLGKIKEFNSYYQAIKLYHEEVCFHEEHDLSSNYLEKHSAPFLAQYFS